MLVKNFSVRSLFVLTTLVAVYSLLLASAMRGSVAAAAVCIAVLGLLFVVLNYVLCFAAVAWSAERKRLQTPQPQSPFATETPPKRYMPPIE